MSVLTPLTHALTEGVAQPVAALAHLLEPVAAQTATAAAIVLFTVLVRLALHPLSRAAFRGTTPSAGCLPVLVQLPVFFFMYRAFTSVDSGLLGERLFAAPLGAHWTDALGDGGPFGAPGLVFLGLFAAIAAIAAWSAVRGRRAARSAGGPELPASVPAEQREAMRKLSGVLPLLSFGTLVTAAVVPLAAGLYLVATTGWTVAERAWLQHRKDRAGRGALGGERSSL
ncbi:YidC/Oxa1 family membrane protein insertase [Streptomyces sp. NBC_00536]|uniref:YidC/Oxa1 family membrane protein insertase n=1 Tax=Streptomyces sp. NBC_00536 TaxID=2975769 RepID=UPI002E81F276|nr:YidC/Oxa1 family membrane protein insertase [Streptomyces sp. NBC_00536]WUC79251.1 YidC/Oxa1 family membrane protein insertase [Streptomyces sp. NBC_00536]